MMATAIVSVRASAPQAIQNTTYHWDGLNRLIEVDVPEGGVHKYGYDYRTRRITTQEGGATTVIVFSGGLSLAEYSVSSPGSSVSGSATVQYQRGPDMGGGVGGLLYSLRGGDAKFNLSNGRGDIVAQSNASGLVTWTASYEADGKRPVETGTNLDKQRGNSKDEDPTGLLNEGFRYRDLNTGLWLSRDPAGFVDGPNMYAYVKQNPWTAFDAEGLEARAVTQTVNGKNVTRLTITGVVLDATKQDFTIRRKDGSVAISRAQEVETMRKNIVEGINKTFKGENGDRRWEMNADLRLVKDMSEVKSSDHVYKIIHVSSGDDPVLGASSGYADFGSKIVLIQSVAARLGPSETAGHETGHSLGLRHPNVNGIMGRGKDSDNPISNLSTDNFMGYNKANQVDPRQIDLIQHYSDQGDLSGAHYGEDGKWKNQKTQSEVFGKKRFSGGVFPEASARK